MYQHIPNDELTRTAALSDNPLVVELAKRLDKAHTELDELLSPQSDVHVALREATSSDRMLPPDQRVWVALRTVQNRITALEKATQTQ